MPKVLELAMKEVLNLQKHLMKFTIDCYKTHKTDATTLELYGDHFNDSQENSLEQKGNLKLQHKFRNSKFSSSSNSKRLALTPINNEDFPHHIADNSSSDEIFDDNENESFSSLIPESAKQSKIEDLKLEDDFEVKNQEKYDF